MKRLLLLCLILTSAGVRVRLNNAGNAVRRRDRHPRRRRDIRTGIRC